MKTVGTVVQILRTDTGKDCEDLNTPITKNLESHSGVCAVTLLNCNEVCKPVMARGGLAKIPPPPGLVGWEGGGGGCSGPGP